MSHIFGIALSFIALVCWCFGDFLIQKMVRLMDVWRCLLMIGLGGIIMLLPFIYEPLVEAIKNPQQIIFLLITGAIASCSAIFVLKALKLGKIAVVEPILSFHILVAVLLSLVVKHEQLSVLQFIFIGVIFSGILMSVISPREMHQKYELEKGIILGIIGATFMGIESFFVGVTSLETSPLLTMWIISIFFTIIPVIMISWHREWKLLGFNFKNATLLIVCTSIIDNLAWIAFAAATIFIPISISASISQSYIAGTVLLGVLINKEKISTNQLLGITLTIICVVGLSAITI